jgi:hypothetical protein
MLTPEENELLTRVGPGTPAGAMLRRYWWPVGFSEFQCATDWVGVKETWSLTATQAERNALRKMLA